MEEAEAEAEAVTIEREEFGVAVKSPVYLYWLRSPDGLAVAVSTWGASVVHVCAPNREGVVEEVTEKPAPITKVAFDNGERHSYAQHSLYKMKRADPNKTGGDYVTEVAQYTPDGVHFFGF